MTVKELIVKLNALQEEQKDWTVVKINEYYEEIEINWIHLLHNKKIHIS